MRTAAAATSSIGALALITSGLAIVATGTANAYVVNQDGSVSVSSTELQAAFGPSVNLSAVTFSLDGGDTVYAVSCQKSPGRSGHTIRHDFRRHAETSWTVTSTPVSTNGVITSFTLVATKAGEDLTRVVCPPAFLATPGTAPTPVGMTDVEVLATYNGQTVELENTTPAS